MGHSGSRACIDLYPLAVVLSSGYQRQNFELFLPDYDSLLASVVYIVGSHIVQGFVIAPLVAVVDKLRNRCPEPIGTKREHQATVVFECPVRALELTDGLGEMATGSPVAQAVHSQEVSHGPGDIAAAIVRQHSRLDQVRRPLQVTGLYRLLDSPGQAGRLDILD